MMRFKRGPLALLERGLLQVSYQRRADVPPHLLIDCLIEHANMKTKKSAALAVLKPTEIKSTPSPVKSTSSAAKTNSGAVTTIDVKIDVGFGNAVYLRGQGSGLTWEQGVPLSCVDGGTWRWSQTVAAPITFKVLLNDQVWSAGGDLVVKPGQKLEVSPSFA
jgi:hypothetical protein